MKKLLVAVGLIDVQEVVALSGKIARLEGRKRGQKWDLVPWVE
jgi:hypothetical protein